MKIEEIEREIRDIINSARRQNELLSVPQDWNKICTALDLIGDTQLAIKSYPPSCKNEDVGSFYLLVYGILQTLLLQQDAAKYIASVLKIKIKLPKELSEIRVVRNSAAGHPVFQKENGLSKSCSISRHSLTPMSFELVTVFAENKDYKFTHIDISKLIETQHNYLYKLLDEVLCQVKLKEEEHRMNHRNTKLQDCFPHTISYFFSKVYESILNNTSDTFGAMHLKLIQDSLNDFKEKLEQRGEWGVYDSVNYHYELLEYPLAKLNSYFDSSSVSDINEKDAYIFTSFVSEHIDKLSEIAAEIDEEYASDAQA